MDSLGRKCGFASLEDWYKITASHFRSNKGKLSSLKSPLK